MEHALHKFRTTTHSRGNTLLVYADSAVVLMFYGVNTLGVHFFNATNIVFPVKSCDYINGWCTVK
jgi:hypothetical protein